MLAAFCVDPREGVTHGQENKRTRYANNDPLAAQNTRRMQGIDLTQYTQARAGRAERRAARRALSRSRSRRL